MRLPFLKQNKTIDLSIVILVLVLEIAGLVFISSASSHVALQNFGNKYYFFSKKLLVSVIGTLIMLIVSQIDYKIFQKYAIFLFITSVFLLFIVLLPPFATKVLGARRWIIIGGFQLQPSEISKFALSIYLAALYAKDRRIYSYFVPFLVCVLLVVLEPDLGTAIIISAIALSQIFFTQINLLHFIVVIAGFLMSVLFLILTSSYRKERLLTYLNMTRDVQGHSYHIRQILISLGAGGFFGVGLGQSRQKFFFLPEAQTDSIFAVVAEEAGFIGALILISLYLILFLKLLKIISNAPDKFSYLLTIGFTVWIIGQAFLNIASMVALLPLTGIPLPLISYGGSAMIMNLLAFGVILNISKQINEKR